MDELASKQVLLDFEIIILLTLLVGVGATALVRKFRRGAENRPAPDFDGYDLALMFFPALLFLLNPLLEVLMTGAELESEAPEAEAGAEPLGSLTNIFVNIAYFVFVGVMTYGIIEWIRNRRVVDLFGLDRLGLARILLYAIGGGFAALLICAWGIGSLSQGFLDRIFTDLSAQETVEALQGSDSRLQILLSIVMACVAAPVVEELLFRGYMYGAVKEATNPIFSAVVVGGLFAVVHGNLPALLPLWAFSIFLVIAYEWSRSLWVPIGMHAFFNASNIVLMLDPATR